MLSASRVVSLTSPAASDNRNDVVDDAVEGSLPLGDEVHMRCSFERQLFWSDNPISYHVCNSACARHSLEDCSMPQVSTQVFRYMLSDNYASASLLRKTMRVVVHFFVFMWQRKIAAF